MIKPPSLVREYTWIWSGDPALDAPSDKAPKAARKAWDERLRVARETGQWDGLIKAGATPTKFTLRHIPGSQWRALVDAISSGKIGGGVATAISVRLALRGILNLTTDEGELEVKFGEIEGIGEGAKADVVDVLDAFSPAIVGELGTSVMERQRGAPGPK